MVEKIFLSPQVKRSVIISNKPVYTSFLTLSTAYFVHCEITLHDTLPILRKKCGKYFEELLLHTDAPITDDRDGENELRCFHHKEKLSK